MMSCDIYELGGLSTARILPKVAALFSKDSFILSYVLLAFGVKNDKIPLILPLHLYIIKYNTIYSYKCLRGNLMPSKNRTHIPYMCIKYISTKNAPFSLITTIDCEYYNVNMLR